MISEPFSLSICQTTLVKVIHVDQFSLSADPTEMLVISGERLHFLFHSVAKMQRSGARISVVSCYLNCSYLHSN